MSRGGRDPRAPSRGFPPRITRPPFPVLVILLAMVVGSIAIGSWVSYTVASYAPPARVGSVGFNVADQGNASFSEPSYPQCHTGAGGSSACFTYYPGSSNCSFYAVGHPYALVVTVLDDSGQPLNGAHIYLWGYYGLSLNPRPSDVGTTGVGAGAGPGQFVLTSLTGTVLAGYPYGGQIWVQASYTADQVSSELQESVSVDPPSSIGC